MNWSFPKTGMPWVMVSVARKHGSPSRTWYTRKAGGTRVYHALCLGRVVDHKQGSFWKLIIGPVAISFGYLRPSGARKRFNRWWNPMGPD